MLTRPYRLVCMAVPPGEGLPRPKSRRPQHPAWVAMGGTARMWLLGGVFAGVRGGSLRNHGSVRFETWRTDRVVDAGGRSSPMRPLHTSATVTRRSRPPRALSNMHHAPTAGVEMSLICSLRADNPLWTPEREILPLLLSLSFRQRPLLPPPDQLRSIRRPQF